MPAPTSAATPALRRAWLAGLALVGLTLMLLVIFRPQGILGDKKELAIDVR